MELSNKSAEWVQRVMRDNPSMLLESGNIRTCPVRLSYPHLLTPGKPTKEKPDGGYGSTLLFPLGADMAVYVAAATRMVKEKCPAALTDPARNRIFNPFKKVKAAADPTWQKGDPTDADDGNVFGAPLLRCNSQQRVPTVDQSLRDITDETKAYPGVWAICTVNVFWFAGDTNKGPSFGLNSVMLVADDLSFGGAGGNPAIDFAGVKIDAEVNPSALFGAGDPSVGGTDEKALAELFS